MRAFSVIFISLAALSAAAQTPNPPELNSGITNALPEDVRLLMQDLQVNVRRLVPAFAILQDMTNVADNAALTPTVSPATAQNLGRNCSSPVVSQNVATNLGQNFSGSGAVFPNSAPPAPNGATTVFPLAPNQFRANRTDFMNALGLVLEDVQADIQELLPRLAQLNGLTGAANPAAGSGGLGNSSLGGTSSGAAAQQFSGFVEPLTNSFARPLSNRFATPLTNSFATPLTNGFGQPLTNGFGTQPPE